MKQTAYTKMASNAGRCRTTPDGLPAAHSALQRMRAAAAGFSLVEVMVAMVIGMLGIIVMMQMFSLFEGQKRTTTGGDDAISAGAVSLYGMQRAIQHSGWGINTLPLIGCSVSGLLAGGASLPLVPVTINPAVITGEDANTDTLLIVSGNGNGTVEGDEINSVAGTSYAVHTPSAFTVGERVVVAPQARPIPCNLAVTSIATVLAPNVTVAAAFAGTATGDKLFNLGAAPTVRAYAVRNGNLTVCDYIANNCGAAANNGDSTIWVPIASNVVSLRAEYGRDTTAAGMAANHVVVWDQNVATPATPISSTGAKNIAACGLIRISALRIALVARSSQPEKTLDWPALTQHVTAAAPVWAGSDAVAVGIDAAQAGTVAISLPNPDPSWPTWQDFRYKVFQTVVPLRNITSLGVLAEC